MSEIKKVRIPDIGDFKDVPVVEVLVNVGDKLKAEDSLITLESDKATIEVPSPHSGTVKEITVKVGDKVSEGSEILVMEVSAEEENKATATETISEEESRTITPGAIPEETATDRKTVSAKPETVVEMSAPSQETYSSKPLQLPAQYAEVNQSNLTTAAKSHAGPSVRRFARELGVDLSKIVGSGPKQRILKEDIQAFVKRELMKSQTSSLGGRLDLLPWPQVDFAKFGPIELKPLTRIKQISAANLHRNWVMIPHVTQFDEADITDLEALRKEYNERQQENGIKLTILAFLMKAVTAALKKYPEFNASLDRRNEESFLVLKRYYHLGFAVDTPNGLVVPVIRDADQKGVIAIADELGKLSSVAREGKLKPTDMQGASFTISSLGGIGGTAFTPIINAPEVAILGVSRASLKPIYRNGEFLPRLILPLSLSYDHRVIDGASAARFTSHLASILADMRLALF
ncbi:dihydrolipoyllysine-residue acetyltransferase [Nitrosomonas communis]|uniref:Acetyltransferase component of pyruvate dehydrogenase complex n=1 Tax=Nitrosomonas communis TaxID=44574 RepID=A0A1I4LDM1_9PROT|nr:dihydrolipoyllysine-residue acetyltransferase [Nitrosomonas communis]SFL88923.1 pyruvate dehydrogenase E2 component (dihydrolipoamide acetyltransferase) [Nitrosomonas communis]